MMKKLALIVLVVVFAAAAWMGSAQAADTIKIGFNAPLTGFAASDGKSASEGAKLAVEQINSAGGVNGKMIELVIYDDQAKPAQAIPIANKLIGQDKVVMGVSGSYSGPTRSAAGIFQEAGIPYISAYAIHPDITRAGNYVFRTSFLGQIQGRGGAKLVGDMLGKKRVVVITLQNDFGKSLAAGFKGKAADYGIKIINEYEYSIKDRQFGSIVAKVKADNPEAIYASGYYFTAGPLVNQLRTAGVTVPIIGQEGYDSQKFIEIAGPSSEGVIITTSLDRDSDVPETKNFITAFEKKAGFKVDMVAASAHLWSQLMP
jgi:branched-chain amino acid transport system substrate-binding protein